MGLDPFKAGCTFSLELMRPITLRWLGSRGSGGLEFEVCREGDNGDVFAGAVDDATKLKGRDSRLG